MSRLSAYGLIVAADLADDDLVGPITDVSDVSEAPTGQSFGIEVSELARAILGRAFMETLTYTDSHIIDLVDLFNIAEIDKATPTDWEIPPNSDEPFPIGSVIGGHQYGAGLVTVVAGAGVTIRSRGSALTSAGQYAEWIARKRDTNEWVLTGDLVV